MLTHIQNIMTYAPQFQQRINVDRRMHIGRMLQQKVVNLLHNHQIPRTPQNVNGAVMAITNGQLALQDLGGETAIPLPDAVRPNMPIDPFSPTSVPIGSPTVTGVEGEVGTADGARPPTIVDGNLVTYLPRFRTSQRDKSHHRRRLHRPRWATHTQTPL